MKRTLALAAAVAFTAAAAQAQLSPAEKATAAAETWLKLVDEGAYPDAYAKTSEKCRKSNSEEVFSRILRINRKNKGDFKSRTALSAEKVKGEIQIEGKKVAPMEVRFATEWSEAKATEVVNMIEEGDEWRPLNYGVDIRTVKQGKKDDDKKDGDKKDDDKKDKKKKEKKGQDKD